MSRPASSRSALWRDAFPSEDHRWFLGLRRTELADFFAPTTECEAVLAERVRWLDADPARYAQLLPEGEPAVDETATLLGRAAPGATPYDRLLTLGRACECDLVWLVPRGDGGSWVVVGGVVCFPSHWALSDKLGRPLDAVHQPVPELNAALARRIDAFLAGFDGRYGWRRINWSLTADGERNHHPQRRLPALDEATPPESAFLRFEHQLLYRLPTSGATLFALRIEIVPLTELTADASAAARLAQLLDTMTPAVARYKNLAAARGRIAAYLRREPIASADQT